MNLTPRHSPLYPYPRPPLQNAPSLGCISGFLQACHESLTPQLHYFAILATASIRSTTSDSMIFTSTQPPLPLPTTLNPPIPRHSPRTLLIPPTPRYSLHVHTTAPRYYRISFARTRYSLRYYNPPNKHALTCHFTIPFEILCVSI